MATRELTTEELRRVCDPESLGFETTDDLEPLERTLGQERAKEAFEFGVGIRDEGYNIFAYGASGLGKLTVVRRFLEQRAAQADKPDDWCYVFNFEADHRPRMLRLPAGRGSELQKDMEGLLADLGTALGSAFEGEQYQTRRQTLEEVLKDRQETAIGAVGEAAAEAGLSLLRVPTGMVFAPIKDDEVLTPEDYEKLPEKEQDRLRKEIDKFQEDLQKISRQIPRWQREARENLRELNREICRFAIGPLLGDFRERYAGLEKVREYLEDVEKDIIEQVQAFLASEGGSFSAKIRQLMSLGEGGGELILRRYRVNVLVDHGESIGAPVVYEDNPTYASLVGRIEYRPKEGSLVTDFTLIKPGALHLANGGYLLLEARKLLSHQFAWEGLKRALRAHRIKIESIGQALQTASIVTLEPEPAALDVKIVIVGEPKLYYLLSQHDPEFSQLFKVAADFDERIDWDDEGRQGFVRMVAGLVKTHDLPTFDKGAVARVLEAASRGVDDSEKLSLHVDPILDLLREATYWSRAEKHDRVEAEDVQKALDARKSRTDRYRLRIQEEVLRGTLLIDTEGEKIGQINGLSVLTLGETRFGRPTRITARVRMGKGEMVDIEREVDLGGPLHSKGVLILSSFLGARYATERPLSLAASLVFEQSYGGVDGDSASSAELYSLLSAISEVPIRQSVAVTGSVNQWGEVQAIGGANEKIEGFFDLCAARGLTGEQGVLIPGSNVKHLMLRRDVIEAVEKGNFHVHAVDSIDDGIEILTGVEAGVLGENGEYPKGSINRRVADRLARFGEIWKETTSAPKKKKKKAKK